MSMFSASKDAAAFAGFYERNGERLTQPMGLKVLALLGSLPDKRLLDVAAGTGGLALVAAERGAHVLATDFNLAMVARAAERLAPFENCAAQQMNFEHLSAEDAAYDAAISVFGLLGYATWARGLQELHRVTRPGGRVGLAVWTHRDDCSPAHLLKRVFESTFPGRKLWPDGFAPLFTEESLGDALQQAGLEEVIVQVETVDWSPISSAHVVEECTPLFAGFPGYASLSAEEREALRVPLQIAFDGYADSTGTIRLPTNAFIAVGTKAA